MDVFNYKLNAIMAKSRAMYGQRLSFKDYDSLTACTDIPSFISYLKSRTAYSSAFDGVSTPDIDAGYVEFLIKKYNSERFERLCSYEMSFGEELYNYFIVKDEITLILTYIRSVLLGNTAVEILNIPGSYYKNMSIDVFDLEKAETLTEISDILKGTRYSKALDLCLKSEKQDYTVFECALLNIFYEYEFKLVDRCYKGKGQKELLELLSLKADTGFIDKVYRIKKYFSFCSEILLQNIAPVHLTNLTKKQIKALFDARDENEITDVLSGTFYREYAEKIRNSSFVEQAILENNYNRYKHLIRFSTDPNVVMFCFMFLADIELSNLIHIIEGIKYGTDPQKIKRLLIGAGD